MQIKALLTALVSLIIAVTTQAANIPISSLPFTITGPGTYVVTGNLTFTPGTDPYVPSVAITVSTAIAGAVVIDLKGFTLTSNGSGIGIGIGFASPAVPNSYPITVRNGTLSNFLTGVFVENPGIFLTNITVNNLTFFTATNGFGVVFDRTSSSTISNCTFHGGNAAISDSSSTGGNRYSSDTFFGTNPLRILAGYFNPPTNGILVLGQCDFDPAP